MVKNGLLFLIRFIKILFFVQDGCCRYYPTCTEYAMEAIEKHSMAKSFFLIISRVLRCNPFSKGGFDPVPEKIQRKVIV